MKRIQLSAVIGVLILGLAAHGAYATWPGDPGKCKPDAVKAGSVCIDKYEASVWQVPATNKALITKIQNGTATLTNLTAGGATQISPSSNTCQFPSVGTACTCPPAFPATFPANGQLTQPLYAVSIPGVHPTVCATWFQAQQACANSRKRLPSNGEWQIAVAGTPEGAAGDNGLSDCNTAFSGAAVNTGSRSGCISYYGAFDMVGNVDEWVADWVPQTTSCGGGWSSSPDYQCALIAPFATTGEPGALLRGGNFDDSSQAGPFWVAGFNSPTASGDIVDGGGFGFRCAR